MQIFRRRTGGTARSGLQHRARRGMAKHRLVRRASEPASSPGKAAFMLVCQLEIRVEWGHCDPAQIVYNPNFFD